jgi:outer membrane biosynthesis protein TonB
MSPSYTGETTMNEAAFRDVERSSRRSEQASEQRSSDISSDEGSASASGANLGPWRDKIEVRLDNRQVFFLFFGSALCACMLFVLGVIVGKRLESRGRAAIPEVQDPLAVLDRIGTPSGSGAASASAAAEPALTFPKALIGSGAKAHSAPLAPRVAAPVAPKAPPVVAPKPLPAVAPKAPPAPKAAPAVPPKATAVASAKPAPKILSAPASALPSATIAAIAPSSPATPSLPPTASAKGKFTLVLSSFPDRSEADAFAKRFASQGAYVAVADSPGKHGVYSVRVGSYGSSQEAAAAKTVFEKQTNTIAYIAGR